MAVYLTFALDITDPEGFREYAERVGPTHEHFGGKLLVAGSDRRRSSFASRLHV